LDFSHEIIDLSNKPPEFLQLYAKASGGAGAAKVPLLQTKESTIIESLDISRAVCRGSPLYPQESASTVDAFVALWCNEVEGAYYDVLRASSESQARFALAGYVASLAQLEDRLWQQRMQRR